MFNSALFKQIGRLTFLVSTAGAAILCGAALFLLQIHPDSGRLGAAVRLGLVLLGVFWIRSLERRLMDAGLPRWSFWPYFLAVLAACAGAHMHWILDGPSTLAFFVIVQVPTVLFPSKPMSGGPMPKGGVEAGGPDLQYPEYNRPVGRFEFLLRVLLIGVLFGELFQLAREAAPGLAPWEMRVGVVLVVLVWNFSVEGRLMDAGLPRRLSIPYCLILPGLCALPHFLKNVNLDVALALFVALQVPTIFFRSRTAVASPPAGDAEEQEDARIEPAMRMDGIDYAVYTFLIAGLWHVLHLLRGDTGFGVTSWIVDPLLDAGAFILCVLWTICVGRRLRDAGLQAWALDFCLIVFGVSLLPLSLGAISFPQALVLFVALQIPAVFIRRGLISERILPASAGF